MYFLLKAVGFVYPYLPWRRSLEEKCTHSCVWSISGWGMKKKGGGNRVYSSHKEKAKKKEEKKEIYT